MTTKWLVKSYYNSITPVVVERESDYLVWVMVDGISYNFSKNPNANEWVAETWEEARSALLKRAKNKFDHAISDVAFWESWLSSLQNMTAPDGNDTRIIP